MPNLTLFSKLVVATSSLPPSLPPSLLPALVRFGFISILLLPRPCHPTIMTKSSLYRCALRCVSFSLDGSVCGAWVGAFVGGHVLLNCKTVPGMPVLLFLGGWPENLLLLTRWVIITRSMGKSGRGRWPFRFAESRRQKYRYKDSNTVLYVWGFS